MDSARPAREPSDPKGAFVGRAAELTLLRSATAHGRHVVLLGEAGVGKSALAAQWLGATDAVDLRGWCAPLADPMPLLPFTTAFGSRRSDTRAVLGSALARISPALAGVLRPLLPQFDLPDTAGSEHREDRLYIAIGELLAEMAIDQPVVLVVEDVHWADQQTLDLLTYLMLARRDPGMTVACTLRSGPLLAKAPPVRQWLDRVLTAPQVADVNVGPLTRPEFDEQLHRLMPQLPGSLAQQIYARSEGNPFITEQLASSVGRFEELRLTSSLTALLNGSMDGLSAPSALVLDVLAHVGRPLKRGRLPELLDLDPDQVMSAVSQLIHAGLVVVDVDRLHLRHALTREAVLARSTGIPRRIERRLGWELECEHAVDLAAEAASHYAHAGDWQGEQRMAVRATDRAWDLTAYTDAATWGQRVFRLWTDHPEAWAPGTGQGDIVRRTLTSLGAAGNRQAELLFAEGVWERFSSWDDPVERGDVLSQVACVLMMADPRTGHGYSNQILHDQTVPDSGPKAMVVMSIGLGQLGLGNLSQAKDLIMQAERMAEAASDHARAAACLMWLAALERGSENHADVLDLMTRAQQLIHRDGSARAAVEHAGMASAMWLTLGQLHRGVATAAEGLDVARRNGFAGSFAGTILRANAAAGALELGRVDEAAAFTEPDAGSDMPSGLTDQILSQVRSRLALVRGQVDVTPRAPNSPTPLHHQLRREHAELAAELLLWRGRPEDAWDVAVAALEDLLTPPAAWERPMAGELLTLAARAAADIEQRAREASATTATTSPISARTSSTQTLRNQFANQEGVDPLEPCATIGRIEGDLAVWTAEIARADASDRPDHWQAAADAWTELGSPHRAAYAQWRAAQAAIRHPANRATATAALRIARRSAAGHQPLEAAIEEIANRLHIPGWHASNGPNAPTSPLTIQERRVLQLLALGWTNRQIATELFVSPKTASVHVSHILQKLQVPTRGAAASWAHTAGLAAPDPAE